MEQPKNGRTWLIILLPVIGFLIGLIFQSIIFSHQPIEDEIATLNTRLTVVEMKVDIAKELVEIRGRLDLLLEEP